MGTILDVCLFFLRRPFCAGVSSTFTVYSCLAFGPRARLPSVTSADWFLDRAGVNTLTEEELSLVREVRVEEWCKPSSVSYKLGCSSGMGSWRLRGVKDFP